MRCAHCRGVMDYVHGHAACLDGRCPMFGINQSPCCGGETADQCDVPASDIAAAAPTPPRPESRGR